ncbi:MAG: hypothetical protein K0B15_00750 [Lentimicrobium sp.]|nr:hypothetical protein [Lentimicrobium sp.]
MFKASEFIAISWMPDFSFRAVDWRNLHSDADKVAVNKNVNKFPEKWQLIAKLL